MLEIEYKCLDLDKIQKILQDDLQLSIVTFCHHQLEAIRSFSNKADARLICVAEQGQPLSGPDDITYLNMPFTAYHFKHILLSFINNVDESSESIYLARELVGCSEIIQQTRHMIHQVANCDSNVLILGESGTGKEIVASCIHHLSKRNLKPFVPINCGAIPGELMESELFGHEKGAFTGAMNKRSGRFEMANHGTIFLDEIGDMPLNMQVKLLRVLQERKIERVGSMQSNDIDVRIISATNKHLEEMIAQHTFREDLYYRLNVIPINVPTLRDRVADIPLIVNNLMEKISKRIPNNANLTEEAIQAMCQYNWPGNIRELANFIERLVVLCHDKIIDATIVSEQLHKIKSRHINLPLSHDTTAFNMKEYLSSIEQQIIHHALEKTNDIVSAAAEFLNLRRTTLIEKMKKYKLEFNS